MTVGSLDHNSENENKSLKEIILKLREWFYYLVSKWLIILIFGIIGGIFGFGYAIWKTTNYIATSTFVLEDGGKGGDLGQYAGLASMVGIDMGTGGGLFEGDNIVELYKSRTMIEKALLSPVKINAKSQLLIDRYLEFNDLRKKWTNKEDLKNIKFNVDPVKFNRIQDSVIGKIVLDINKNYLAVSKLDKKLAIIKVDVQSKDEFFAKKFNDQIVATVNDFYIQTKTKKSLENLSILQRQTDSVKRVLTGAIYSNIKTIDATPNLNPSRQILRAPAHNSQFTAESNKAILIELVKNLELSKISLRKEKPLIQIIDTPIFPLPNDESNKLKSVLYFGFIFALLAGLFLTFRKMLIDLIK